MKAISQIIIINFIIHLLDILLQTNGIYINNILALYPINSEYFSGYQLLTHIFAHDGFIHLISNMILLLIVGYDVENKLGKEKTWKFFILSGLFSSGLYFLGSQFPIIGASGAVFSMITAYIIINWTLEFNRKFLKNLFFILIIILELKDTLFETDRIAHLAHIFGVLFSIIYFFNKKDLFDNKEV